MVQKKLLQCHGSLTCSSIPHVRSCQRTRYRHKHNQLVHVRLSTTPQGALPPTTSGLEVSAKEDVEGPLSSVRRVILSTMAGMTMFSTGSDLRAAPISTKQAEKAAGHVVPYKDVEGRFSLVRPEGWLSVQSLKPGSGVLASFYDPDLPGADTLAVYAAASPVPSIEQLGSAKDVGLALANVASFGKLQLWSSERRKGRTYYTVQVEFGGNTAGRFGAVVEARCICIAAGIQYTLRMTSLRSSFLADEHVKDLFDTVMKSFEINV